jgi:hypothetical protein
VLATLDCINSQFAPQKHPLVSRTLRIYKDLQFLNFLFLLIHKSDRHVTLLSQVMVDYYPLILYHLNLIIKFHRHTYASFHSLLEYLTSLFD